MNGISSFLGEKEKALVTSAHNPLLLAERMEDLLKNQAMRDQLGRDIHLKVQELNWSSMAKNIAAIYESM